MKKDCRQTQCAVIQQFIAMQNERLIKSVRKTQIVIWISQIICFGMGIVFGALVF